MLSEQSFYSAYGLCLGRHKRMNTLMNWALNWSPWPDEIMPAVIQIQANLV